LRDFYIPKDIPTKSGENRGFKAYTEGHLENSFYLKNKESGFFGFPTRKFGLGKIYQKGRLKGASQGGIRLEI